MRHSAAKQDEVVAALWDFARMQVQIEITACPQTCYDAIGTPISLRAVAITKRRILKAFGYEPVEIQ